MLLNSEELTLQKIDTDLSMKIFFIAKTYFQRSGIVNKKNCRRTIKIFMTYTHCQQATVRYAIWSGVVIRLII